MIKDIETFFDNSPIPGFNLLPDRFKAETIIKIQQDNNEIDLFENK